MSTVSILVDGLTVDRTAAIQPDDPGLTLGLTVFETLRAVQGRLPLLALHHQRLCASAQALGIPAPDLQTLSDETQRLLTRWSLPTDAAVRITLTAGGRRIVALRPAPAPFQPVSCVTGPWSRLPGLEAVKHGSRAPWVALVRHSGADDIIMVDQGGAVREATCAAVIGLCDGAVVSPPDDGRILPSVTLRALSGQVEVQRRTLRLEEAQALWLCSSLKLLAPVTVLDGAPMTTSPEVQERLQRALLAVLHA